MRIKLLEDLPVDSKHGALKDKVVQAYMLSKTKLTFKGDAGEYIKVESHQYKSLDDAETFGLDQDYLISEGVIELDDD